MSDRSTVEVVSPPPFVRFDKKQREEFLSQYGITSPAQREMFHQLCNSWRPLIDFDSFTAARAGLVSHPAQETENLINRLRAARMAQFTYKRSEKGERAPKDIILCQEGGPRYWFYFVQDLIQQACDNPRNPFLTMNILRARDLVIPVGDLDDLPLGRISKTSLEALAKQEELVFLTLQGERILATTQVLANLLAFSSAKLRFTLKNPDMTTAASRLLNLGLSDVAKRLDDKESGFWRGLTEVLLEHKEDLLADRRLHVDLSFFQAAELFYHYLTNQLEETKRLKELALERETDLKQVEQLILMDKDVVMLPAELESHLRLLFRDKYGESFEALRDEFFASYTQAAPKTGLPVILTLKSGLIHRNNLYRYFLKRFDSLGPLLLQEYQVKMNRRVRHPNSNGELDFLNRANLERSLSEWTAKSDPLVSELFERYQFLAEGIIHHGRANLGHLSVEDTKPLLERFFRPGVMTLKTWQEIYGLDVQYLYEVAFKHLSVFSQFWRRITGAYKIHAEELRVLSLPRGERRDPVRSSSTADGALVDNLGPEDRKVRKEEWSRRKDAQRREKSSDRPPPEPPKPRQYSDGERDKAWTSFRDTLNPKD